MPAERVPVTDPAEREHARTILRRLEQGKITRARYDAAHEREAEAGSDIAGDDQGTAWMHLSHVVTTALTMATDNMRAVDGLLRPDGHLSVPMYAHYPVLRSILEAAALAKWILEPDNRHERVKRLLQARTTDAGHDESLDEERLNAVRAMTNAPPPSSSKNKPVSTGSATTRSCARSRRSPQHSTSHGRR